MTYPLSVPSNTSQVYGLIQGGNAFSNPLSGSINNTSALHQGILTNAQARYSDGSITQDQYQSITGSMDQVNSGILDPSASDINNPTGTNSLAGYSNGVIGAMPGRMGTAKSGIHAQQTLNQTSNPCSSISDAFGSLTGGLSDILGDIENGMSSILSNLSNPFDQSSGIFDEISSALSDLESSVASVGSFISKEISSFLDLSDISQTLGQALSLINLGSDQCISGLLSSIGSISLRDTLGIA